MADFLKELDDSIRKAEGRASQQTDPFLQSLDDSIAKAERRAPGGGDPFGAGFDPFGGQSPTAPQPAATAPAVSDAGMTGGLDPGGIMVPTEVGQDDLADYESHAKAVGIGALQGATFNFADEIAGVVSNDWKQSLREAEATARKKHPYLTTAGEVVGALGTGFATGGTATAALRGVRPLATTGALTGIGIGEAGLAEVGAQNVLGEERKLDVGQVESSMIMGGAFGAAAPKAINLVRRGFQNLLSRQAGLNRGARLFLKDASRKKLTVEEYGAAAKAEPQLDLPSTQIGAAELTRDAAKAAPEIAGRYREIIRSRSDGQGSRLMQSIEPEMGNASSIERLEQLTESTRTQVRPEYERIHQLSFTPSEQTVSLMNNPTMKRAVKIAEGIARDEGVPFRYNPTSGAPMTGQQADYIQQALREMSEEGAQVLPNGSLKLTRTGRGRAKLREAVMDDFDAQLPGFKRTRQLWAQLEDAKKAEEIGRKLHGVKGKASVFKKTWNDMSPLQREYAKHGYITEMTDLIKNVADDANVARKFNTDKHRAILKTMLGDEGAEKFINQVAVESAYVEFARDFGRIRTTEPAFQTKFTSPGSPVGLKYRLINIPINLMSGGMDKVSALAVGEALLSQNIDEMLTAMNRVNPRLRRGEAAFVGLGSRDVTQDTATGAAEAAGIIGVVGADYFGGGTGY